MSWSLVEVNERNSPTRSSAWKISRGRSRRRLKVQVRQGETGQAQDPVLSEAKARPSESSTRGAFRSRFTSPHGSVFCERAVRGGKQRGGPKMKVGRIWILLENKVRARWPSDKYPGEVRMDLRALSWRIPRISGFSAFIVNDMREGLEDPERPRLYGGRDGRSWRWRSRIVLEGWGRS